MDVRKMDENSCELWTLKIYGLVKKYLNIVVKDFSLLATLKHCVSREMAWPGRARRPGSVMAEGAG